MMPGLSGLHLEYRTTRLSPDVHTKYLSVDSSGLLYKGRRIVVPPSLQEKIIQEYHCQSHPGPEITATQIRARFW